MGRNTNTNTLKQGTEKQTPISKMPWLLHKHRQFLNDTTTTSGKQTNKRRERDPSRKGITKSKMGCIQDGINQPTGISSQANQLETKHAKKYRCNPQQHHQEINSKHANVSNSPNTSTTLPCGFGHTPIHGPNKLLEIRHVLQSNKKTTSIENGSKGFLRESQTTTRK
jgi:hypothetical protein